MKAAVVTSSLCTFSTFQAQTLLISVHTHGHIMSIDRSCLLKGLQPSQAALTGNCLFNPNLSQLQLERLIIILCAAHNPEIIYEMFGDYNLRIKAGLWPILSYLWEIYLKSEEQASRILANIDGWMLPPAELTQNTNYTKKGQKWGEKESITVPFYFHYYATLKV